jgi:hypothetical protein
MNQRVREASFIYQPDRRREVILLAAMLVLGFGPLAWSFPAWMWGVAVACAAIESTGDAK